MTIKASRPGSGGTHPNTHGSNRSDEHYSVQVAGAKHRVQENATGGSRYCYTCDTTVDEDERHDR